MKQNQKTIVIIVAVIVIVVILSSCISSIAAIFFADDPSPPAKEPTPSTTPSTTPPSTTTPPTTQPPSTSPPTTQPPTTQPPTTQPPSTPPTQPPATQPSTCVGFIPISSKHAITDYQRGHATNWTVEQCSDYCQKDGSCDWFTYKPYSSSSETGECYMGTFQANPEPDAYTAIKLADSTCNYIYSNAPSVGKKLTLSDGNPIKNVSDINACKRICDNTPGCEIAHFEEKDGDCTLLQGENTGWTTYMAAYKSSA